MNNLAIASMSGSFKSIFVHGVLTAFEKNKLHASAYAASSCSVMPTSMAAIGQLSSLSIEIWFEMLKVLEVSGTSMSHTALLGIQKSSPILKKHLFKRETARLLIACSFVNNAQAAAFTQGEKYSRLGRRLLLDASRNDTTWRDSNLNLHVYDTQSTDPDLMLNEMNYDEVAYAATRMLHAWPVPAVINNKPYVDSSYTNSCPVIPLVERGYKKIIAISTETGPIYTDLFSSETIPQNIGQSKIFFIRPQSNLREFGVNFTKATEDGFVKAFQHGIEMGDRYIFQHSGDE
ncbi:hypothetical protein KAR48_20525 [bacterium]|nr:hypothetical protein [bacterium]